MSGNNIYSALSLLHVAFRLLGLAPCPLSKTGTAFCRRQQSPFGFSTLHNYMILFTFGWFLFDRTWDAICKYPKLSSKSLIPIIFRTFTFTSTCLSLDPLSSWRSWRVLLGNLIRGWYFTGQKDIVFLHEIKGKEYHLSIVSVCFFFVNNDSFRNEWKKH